MCDKSPIALVFSLPRPYPPLAPYIFSEQYFDYKVIVQINPNCCFYISVESDYIYKTFLTPHLIFKNIGMVVLIIYLDNDIEININRKKIKKYERTNDKVNYISSNSGNYEPYLNPLDIEIPNYLPELEYQFVNLVRELNQVINSNISYEIIRSSSAIAQLILDRDCVFDKIKRKYNIKDKDITFKVAPYVERPGYLSRFRRIIPAEYDDQKYEMVRKDTFINQIVLELQNTNYTRYSVKNIIEFLRNIKGGAHYEKSNKNTKDISHLLKEINNKITIDEVSVLEESIKSIYKATVKAMIPLLRHIEEVYNVKVLNPK